MSKQMTFRGIPIHCDDPLGGSELRGPERKFVVYDEHVESVSREAWKEWKRIQLEAKSQSAAAQLASDEFHGRCSDV